MKIKHIFKITIIFLASILITILLLFVMFLIFFVLDHILPFLLFIYFYPAITLFIFPYFFVSCIITLIKYVLKSNKRCIVLFSRIFLITYLCIALLVNVVGYLFLSGFGNEKGEWIAPIEEIFDQVEWNNEYYSLIYVVTGFHDKVGFVTLYKSGIYHEDILHSLEENPDDFEEITSIYTEADIQSGRLVLEKKEILLISYDRSIRYYSFQGKVLSVTEGNLE